MLELNGTRTLRRRHLFPPLSLQRKNPRDEDERCYHDALKYRDHLNAREKNVTFEQDEHRYDEQRERDSHNDQTPPATLLDAVQELDEAESVTEEDSGHHGERKRLRERPDDAYIFAEFQETEAAESVAGVCRTAGVVAVDEVERAVLEALVHPAVDVAARFHRNLLRYVHVDEIRDGQEELERHEGGEEPRVAVLVAGAPYGRFPVSDELLVLREVEEIDYGPVVVIFPALELDHGNELRDRAPHVHLAVGDVTDYDAVYGSKAEEEDGEEDSDQDFR